MGRRCHDHVRVGVYERNPNPSRAISSDIGFGTPKVGPPLSTPKTSFFSLVAVSSAKIMCGLWVVTRFRILGSFLFIIKKNNYIVAPNLNRVLILF